MSAVKRYKIVRLGRVIERATGLSIGSVTLELRRWGWRWVWWSRVGFGKLGYARTRSEAAALVYNEWVRRQG